MVAESAASGTESLQRTAQALRARFQVCPVPIVTTAPDEFP